MTTAPVLIAPAPRSQPESFAEPQPLRHLHLLPSPQLTIDDLMEQNAQLERDRHFGPVPTRQSDLPPADTLIRGFFVAVAEVMVGRRSVDQLSQNASLPVMQWLRDIRPRGTGAAPVAPPRIRKVHLCQVRDGVNEATAIIQHGPHVRAMNARFVGLDNRWQCVRLELV
jgi:hypothetical protein